MKPTDCEDGAMAVLMMRKKGRHCGRPTDFEDGAMAVLMMRKKAGTVAGLLCFGLM